MVANVIRVVIALVVLGGFAGCRTAPIHDVVGAPLGASPASKVTLADVAKAIHAAGTELGWIMKDVRPGELLGTLNLRKHVAVVTVTHDTTMFTIRHKSSENLLDDGQSIHRKYNLWVQNLAHRIQQKMGRAG